MRVRSYYELENDSKIKINSVCELKNVEYFIELENDETREEILRERNIHTNGIEIDLNKTEVVFCKFLNYTCHLDSEDLQNCLFYSTAKSGIAFEGIF